ncbi:MAG: hypothetical protein JXA10_16205 [Anaerolineae bacterium]|nr:hypothetical protein [Anaerolineae bacterium]
MMDAFDRLQAKLIAMWQEIGSSLDERETRARTIVVVPSLTSDAVEMTSSAQQAYEERLLFLLFLLRKPNIRLIYVTSQPIQPDIIEYYLNLLPGVVLSNARKRLYLVSPEDGSPDSLTEKLLARPALIQHIRDLIPDPNQTHIVPFLTTDLERELAVKLGIPMYAADPRFFAFGTKSGCRRVFAEENVQHPLGVENLYSVDALSAAIADMRAQHHAQGQTLDRVVIKLNEGVSGLGNALLDLANLPDPGAEDEIAAITARLHTMQFEASDATYNDYMATLADAGAIVEEFITGVAVRSPSAQLRVSPLGEVEMLSTHDQMLGGPSGQSYLGAIFPANPAYSWLIMRDAAKIGERFAREGIVGRFAVDFVVVQRADGTWNSYAIEVNLRKGGTTAPFLILQYLTDGDYHAEEGIFYTAQGQPKYYIATDHLEAHAYRTFTTQHLFDLVSDHRLHFNHATQTGAIMHLITGVAESGRVGVTVIADSPEEANAQYHAFIAVLDREAALLAQM